MTADYDEESRRRVIERSLVGRMGRPEDIAAVAQFLISDAASYIDWRGHPSEWGWRGVT